MSEIYVVTSGKGGVGKTTTTANLGVGFAMRGKSVVLIDTDTGLRNLDLLLGLENRIMYDLVDVTTGRVPYKKALVRRITPLECERLQGLPGHYTNLKGTPCSDSARYKAIGNGMAQPCADFVLKRLSLAVGPGIKEWIPTETADQHRDSEKVIDFQKYRRHAKQKSKNQ